MQALILAGGEGTRLRPLTSTVPKPVMPLVGRPFIGYMLDWLRGHGVDDVVISCGFMATGVRNVLGDGDAYGMRLRYAEEPGPLGTAGAIKFAEDLLDERFLVLNGDVLSDFDLGAQIAQHEATGARATISLIGVEDPSAYGLVRVAEDHSVTEFLEKPSPDQIDTNLISAGSYVLDRDVLDLVPAGTNVSIEREVFPRLIGAGLYAYRAEGYWLDIGTPDRYLQGTFDILEGNVRTAVTEGFDDSFRSVDPDARVDGRVVPPAVVQAGAHIGAGAHVGALAVIGREAQIGPRAIVERAVVFDGARVGEDCVLRECVIAAGASVGAGTRVDGGAILGEGVAIGAHNTLTAGVRIFPGVTIPDQGIAF